MFLDVFSCFCWFFRFFEAGGTPVARGCQAYVQVQVWPPRILKIIEFFLHWGPSGCLTYCFAHSHTHQSNMRTCSLCMQVHLNCALDLLLAPLLEIDHHTHRDITLRHTTACMPANSSFAHFFCISALCGRLDRVLWSWWRLCVSSHGFSLCAEDSESPCFA